MNWGQNYPRAGTDAAFNNHSASLIRVGVIRTTIFTRANDQSQYANDGGGNAVNFRVISSSSIPRRRATGVSNQTRYKKVALYGFLDQQCPFGTSTRISRHASLAYSFVYHVADGASPRTRYGNRARLVNRYSISRSYLPYGTKTRFRYYKFWIYRKSYEIKLIIK